MNNNTSANDSSPYFTRCLGTYYLTDRPSGSTFATYISVIVILSIFSVLSAVGNGLIIYVYIKQKSLQRTNTFLLVCLAFVDFVSAVVLEPLYVVRLLSEIFGFTSCVYVLIVRRLLEYLRPVSFMTLALTTIERYLALFKAITHRRMATKRRLFYAVVSSWLVWFLVICIRSFSPSITNAFYIFFTFIAFSLLVGNLFMYFKIGKLARLHSRPTRVSTTPGSISAGNDNTRTRGTGSLTVQGENPRPTNPVSSNSPVVLCSNTSENMERNKSVTEVEMQRPESLVKKSVSTSRLHAGGKDLTEIRQVDVNHNSSEGSEMKCTHLDQNSCDSEEKPKDKPVESIPSGSSKNREYIINNTKESQAFKITIFKTSMKGENPQEEICTAEQNSAPPISTGNYNLAKRNTRCKSPPRKTKRVNFKNASKSVVETRERNATWTVFYIVAIITICYVPISALLVKLSFQNEPDATSLFIFVPIADTIALFNALVNPFVYCYKNRKMREAVKNVFRKTKSF